jgi:Spy/CpxP family protein refolding chaperone
MRHPVHARAVAASRTSPAPWLTAGFGLALALLFAVAAQAQPAQNANVWGGLDHQPAAGSGIPRSPGQEQQVDHELDTLQHQLENFKPPHHATRLLGQPQESSSGSSEQD